MTEEATAQSPDLLAPALALAGDGLPVFPCIPGGKTPATRHGFLDATTDPARIRRWWTASPQANIATPTGWPGFDVLDVDVRPNGTGWVALHRLKVLDMLDGWIRAVATPSGGLHLHFPGTEQRNGSIRGQHLDFRGQGGYVLLPPSIVITNGRAGQYRVTATSKGPGHPLDWAAVVHELAPEQVPHLYGAREPSASTTIQGLVRHVQSQAEGNRDNALFWAACRAVEGGLTELEPLLAAATHAGLPEQQARRTIRSAIDTVGRDAAQGPPARPLNSFIAPEVRSVVTMPSALGAHQGRARS